MKNSVELIGRIGRTPESTSTKSGTAVCKFPVATWYKGKDGETKTTWHQVVAFNGTAKNILKYLDKGSLVQIDGVISNGTYEDKDGNKRYYSEVIVQSLLFLDKKKTENGHDSQGSQPEEDYPHFGGMIGDNDIPF